MKYIILGDLHIGVKNSSKVYHSVAKDLCENIIEYAEAEEIKGLIQVGDFFDNRKALTHDSIECGLWIADMFNKSFNRSYFIIGNHDTANKDTMYPHSLMIFDEFDNIDIIDEPIRQGNILMLPWLFDPDKDMTDADICIGHFDINGAEMNSAGTLSRNHRLNFSNFSRYQMTISGHYHTPKTYQHGVHYIGTPYQLTFNDMGSPRGFWVLDTNDKTMYFIKFDKYPHHYSYTDKSTDIADIRGHIVRLLFTEDHGIDGNKEIINKFRAMEPLSLRTKFAKLDDDMTEETISEETLNMDRVGIIHNFFDKSDIPENINIDLLKKMTEKIYKEIKDV